MSWRRYPSRLSLDADYERMEATVRTLLRMFDVTRVPGYLARNFHLQVESGTPQVPHLSMRAKDTESIGHYQRKIEAPEEFDWLPDEYFSGYTDLDGETHLAPRGGEARRRSWGHNQTTQGLHHSAAVGSRGSVDADNRCGRVLLGEPR